MKSRPLHRIAAAIESTQRDTLELMRELERDGHVEPVGTDRFWRLTAAAEAEYGQALRALQEAA